MKKFKYDKVKKEALLKYVDSVAVIYYTKHRVVYEKDSINHIKPLSKT